MTKSWRAGQEIDFEIARRVFGLQPCPDWHYVRMGPASGWTNNDGHDYEAHHCYPEQCPVQYSQLIQAAWLAVEKMLEMGWSVSIRGYGPCEAGSPMTWFVSITCPRGPCVSHGNTEHNWHGVKDIEADSAPLAICIATLEVMHG